MCRLSRFGITMESAYMFLCAFTILLSYLQLTRADRCDTCRRHSRACQLIRREFTDASLPSGYNYISEIPAGVCSINITEIGPSSNYIALKTVSGRNILNSQWAITSPGVYHKAGTIFKYGRTRDSNCPGECVLALGPTNETIEFQLLTYHTNPGFVYEYQLPGVRWTQAKKQNGGRHHGDHKRKHHRHNFHKRRHEKVFTGHGSLGAAPTYTASFRTDNSRVKSHPTPNTRNSARTAGKTSHRSAASGRRSTNRPHGHTSFGETSRSNRHQGKSRHRSPKSGYSSFQEASTASRSFSRSTAAPSVSHQQRRRDHRKGSQHQGYVSRKHSHGYQELTLAGTSDDTGHGQGRYREVKGQWQHSSKSKSVIPKRRYLPASAAETGSWNPAGVKSGYVPYRENLHYGSRYGESGRADWEGKQLYQPSGTNAQSVSSEYPQLRVREEPKYVPPYGQDSSYGQVQPLTNQQPEYQHVHLPEEQSSYLTSNQALPTDPQPVGSRGGQNQPFLPDVNSHVISPDISGTDYSHGGEVRTIRYSWRIRGFTNCSLECGGGVQDTVIICVKGNSEAVVTEDNCDARIKPEPQQVQCNLKPCPPQWETGDWSDCSTTCGQGLQRRRVECKKRVSPVLQVSVSAKRCSSLAKPSIVQQCRSSPCVQWQTEDWGQCSVRCGKGQRRRRVSCVDGNNSPIPESHCKGERPSTVETCHRGSCSRHWYYSEWSDSCSTDCGARVSTRQVHCLSKDGNALKEKRCDQHNKPDTQQACDTRRPCGGQWFAGPWKKCSALCGKGLTTREVICMREENSGSHRPVPDGECAENSKPSREKPCEGSECGVQWYMTDWSPCSVTCDNGHQTREVRCLDRALGVSSLCDTGDKPERRKPCSKQACNTVKETTEPDCKDKLTNCIVVAQARLCRYKFYTSVCCGTCSKPHH